MTDTSHLPEPGGESTEDRADIDDDRPWYEHPAAYTVAALLGLLVIIVVLVSVLGDGDGDAVDPPSSTSTTTSTTSSTTLPDADSTPTTSAAAPAPSPSAGDRCRGGDVDACSSLSDSEIDGLCGEGVDAACLAADISFENSPYSRCERGEDAGCAELDDGGIVAICPDPQFDTQSAACTERLDRGI